MEFSDSESSEKNNSENINLLKKAYSDKKKKNPINDLSRSINESKNDDNNKEIKNSEKDLFKNQYIRNITKTYKYITRTLEEFIEKNYSNYKFVNSSLKVIYSHIKIYLSSLKKSKTKDKRNDNNDNQNLFYQFQIDDLNQQIKDLKYEIGLLSSKENNNIEDGSPKKFKIYTYLKRKNLRLSNKTKLDEYKYLLCIKDQQNKINDLENKLKLKVLENSKEVQDSKCFPIITKFDIKELINRKPLPLTETILKNSKASRRNITNASNFKKDNFLTLKNFSYKTPYKMLNEKQNKEKENKIRKKKLNDGYYKTINLNMDMEKNNKEIKAKNGNEADIHFKVLKLNTEIIPNKDKNFFISHPNLTIAGINQKLGKYNIGIPNKLFSFKFGKSADKSGVHKFPSTLNEIFVELEKLRIHVNNNN